MIVPLFEKAGNYRFSSLIQAALSNIERYCKHSSTKALLPIVLDKSRTCNLRLRRPTLYPIELRGLIEDIISISNINPTNEYITIKVQRK